MKVKIYKVETLATIDEGSEINCVDLRFAMKIGLLFIPTSCVAFAAGSTNIVLAGESKEQVKAMLEHNEAKAEINLGRVVIVKNLGVDVLIGEPGKVDNNMTTHPNKRMIEIGIKTGQPMLFPYYHDKGGGTVHHCKAVQKEVVYPQQSLRVELPANIQNESYVKISPQHPLYHGWILGGLKKVNKDGSIFIKNVGNRIAHISKNEHFATIYPCKSVDLEELSSETYVTKIYDLNRKDLTHLIPNSCQDFENKDNFLDQIILDPDDVLVSKWKKRFLNVCTRFSHIITPRPGRYNGFYGRIDNSINFTSTPPPSVKAYLPKYNHDMLTVMAEKMDKLEEWGVLKKPEDIGVVPEFVLPSMLMPKTEKGEWRLVTDFTPLNIHIKKLETVSPTIKEAKEKLAKYKYHIQLDLSNYFYQGGMKIEDCQYLATPHPFKGLRVYVCEPQGLKNASEHAYERLGLVYGDMCAAEKMTRMADGLYVLADTLHDLEDNFIEVLSRAELCGFTVKPSKLIITPHRTTIFGWEKIGSSWRPTSHVISPLIKASPPSTVKQARSWIGSFKQLTECIPRYAVLLGPLEKVLASRASAERVEWDQSLLSSFQKCKQALNDIKTVFVPKPTDILHTWSDYSASEKAVGGRLEIHRKENGVVKKLLGGHFSCRVNKHQKQWYACEGEALAVRLVLEHFLPYIRENKNQTIHHTDNQPVVQAWRKSKTGAFSTSARISAFLSGVSTMNVEIIHTPGREMKSSDYNSRHPEECADKKCQICKLELTGNNISKITVNDVDKGTVKMPFHPRSAWLKAQHNDKTHQELEKLLRTS